MQTSKINPTIFFTQKCEKKFQEIKNKIKNFNNGEHRLFHIGNDFSFLELQQFKPDIIIENFDEGKIFVLDNDHFKQTNPFI